MTKENKRHSVKKKGVVVGDKMDKTVVVRVERTYRHPRYQKVITRGRKYYAHYENNASKIGDAVTIALCRPLSKSKRWRVVEA